MNKWLLILPLITLLGCTISSQESNQEIISMGSISGARKLEASNESIIREFRWSYNNNNWSMVVELYERTYEFYINRSRHRDYDLFASDPYDDESIRTIAGNLKMLGTSGGITDDEMPYFAASFVQAMPYTPDNVTTSYDDYPRFPYETLYDNGGDCEDTAILTAAIIQELDYDVALIKLPGHVAVGVSCSEAVGDHYNYNSVNYCYLETTGEGWFIGELPDNYKNSPAEVIPIYKRPYLEINSNYSITKVLLEVRVRVNVTINNLGSIKASSVRTQVSLQTNDLTTAWDLVESEELDINPEEIVNYQTINLATLIGNEFRVCVKAYGNNFFSEDNCGGWVNWG